MSDARDIIKRVEAVAYPVLDEMGMELVLAEYGLERGGMVLRLFVDRLGDTGVTVDDLTRASREIGPILEVEDVIGNPFRLEMSSPGLDRPLGKLADCDRFAGQEAVIKTRRSIDGRKNFTGTLKGSDGDEVLLEEEGKVHRIKWEMIRKANLKPDIFGAK